MPKTELMEDEAEIDVPSGKIVMDSVSEYCRGLGDIPTYGMAGNRDDVDEEDLIDVEREKVATTSRMDEEVEMDDDDVSDKGGWYERDINDTDRPRSTASSESVSAV